MRILSLVLTTAMLAACAPAAPEYSFASLCGNSYGGAVVSDDPQDEDWRKETLVLGPVDCPETGRYVMPLAVGTNQSRTWFLGGDAEGMELRHMHTLPGGMLDPVSDYGGVSGPAKISADGTIQYDFPADARTIEIFNNNGLEVSTTNVWTLELNPAGGLAYTLRREGRFFRAEFDIANPI